MTRGGRPANHFELGMLQEVGGATAQNKKFSSSEASGRRHFYGPLGAPFFVS